MFTSKKYLQTLKQDLEIQASREFKYIRNIFQINES